MILCACSIHVGITICINKFHTLKLVLTVLELRYIYKVTLYIHPTRLPHMLVQKRHDVTFLMWVIDKYCMCRQSAFVFLLVNQAEVSFNLNSKSAGTGLSLQQNRKCMLKCTCRLGNIMYNVTITLKFKKYSMLLCPDILTC